MLLRYCPRKLFDVGMNLVQHVKQQPAKNNSFKNTPAMTGIYRVSIAKTPKTMIILRIPLGKLTPFSFPGESFLH